MKLKVGDKLLCKNVISIKLKIGKYYTILKIDNNNNIIHFDNYYFYTNPRAYEYYNYIWEYFYTPQEVRKLKLKQLNETKSR